MAHEEIKKAIIENTTKYAGSAASTLVGTVLGGAAAGPEGAVIGSLASTAVEHIFEKIGNEISKRTLAPLEEQRVGSTYAAAAKLINEKIAQEDRPRNDNFFEPAAESRSAGEELLEGTLLAAQREHEEKKLAYLARLYANILFNPEISKPIANHLVKLAEQLTYRQIVALGTIGFIRLTQSMNPSINLLKKNAYGSVSGIENVAIAAEIFEMYRMNILGSSDAILDSAGINPSALTVIGYGAHLYNLMELGSLNPDTELQKLQGQILTFLTGAQ